MLLAAAGGVKVVMNVPVALEDVLELPLELSIDVITDTAVEEPTVDC